MTTNPPNLRPDLAPAARITETPRSNQPTIGMVSLGCPKALVDSERILTRLRAEGYGFFFSQFLYSNLIYIYTAKKYSFKFLGHIFYLFVL